MDGRAAPPVLDERITINVYRRIHTVGGVLYSVADYSFFLLLGCVARTFVSISNPECRCAISSVGGDVGAGVIHESTVPWLHASWGSHRAKLRSLS
jgi:hypothetical protein